MARHDFEELLEDVKNIVINNFNNKLTALSTEKNDGIILPELNANAFFLQSLNDSIANFDPFIAYGIENIVPSNNGPQNSERIFISVVIVLSDNGRNNINQIMFRYSRAMKEIFEDNWQIANSSTRIGISRSTVVPFEALDSSATYKAIGIELELNLA
jgi:hypothetical protein